ncbi:MAG: DUF378 domain-containing protein [Candidatus Paceibacterota bacterium]
MKALHGVSFVLLVIGGLNWLLVGVGSWFGGNWNIVTLILGSISWLENLVYVLVGLATIVILLSHKKSCKECDKVAPAPQM